MMGRYVKVTKDGIPYVGTVVAESSDGFFDIRTEKEDGSMYIMRHLTIDDIDESFDAELLMSYSEQLQKARDFFLKSNEDFHSKTDFFENYENMAKIYLGGDNEENVLKIIKILMEMKSLKLKDLKLDHKDFEKTCLHLINFLSMMLLLKEKSGEDA